MVTRENAANAQELAASSELFIQQSQKQSQIMSFFKINAAQEQAFREELINKMKDLILNLDLKNLNLDNFQNEMKEKILSSSKTDKKIETIKTDTSKSINPEINLNQSDDLYEKF